MKVYTHRCIALEFERETERDGHLVCAQDARTELFKVDLAGAQVLRKYLARDYHPAGPARKKSWGRAKFASIIRRP